MIVNKIDRKAELSKPEIINLQIILYCYFQKITLIESDLICLYLLAAQGSIELASFCTNTSEAGYFISAQVVRNIIAKNEERGLIVKTGKGKKMISIDPTLAIQTEGNILLDLKFLSREASKS